MRVRPWRLISIATRRRCAIITVMEFVLYTLNAALLVFVAALAPLAVEPRVIAPPCGAITVAVTLVDPHHRHRRAGSCARWPASSKTSASCMRACRPSSRRLRCHRSPRSAPSLEVPKRRDPLRGRALPLWQRAKGVLEHVSTSPSSPGEKRRHRWPLRRWQIDAGEPASALLRRRSRPHRRSTARTSRSVTQESLRAQHRPRHARHVAAASLSARQHPLRTSRSGSKRRPSQRAKRARA